MTLNQYFDRIFCINLARRTDKYQQCAELFARHGLQVEFVTAVDGREQPKHDSLMPGEVGCSLSHGAVLQAILDRGLSRALVLEDDVDFVEDLNVRFSAGIQGIPAWTLLYLGGNNVNPPVRVNTFIAKATKTYTTSSYGITNGMARLCLPAAMNPRTQVDVMYASRQQGGNSYVFHPPLAWQRPGFSDIQEGQQDYTPYLRPRT